MYSARAQAVRVPAEVDTLERTSTPVLYKIIAEKRRWLNLSDGSNYLGDQNAFNGFEATLDRLLGTPANWNSYNSPPPSAQSVKNARPILQALRIKLLQPDRVLPSAEGGVAFTFVSDTSSRAVIETLNDGGTFLLLYDLSGNSKEVDWPTNFGAQLDLIDGLLAHLRRNGIAPQG
jgi:hypothetical protein